VVCITATKGEAGVQDESRWPAERLGEIRAQELRAALDIIGINEHHWLGYIDGTCESVDPAVAVGQIVPFIADIKPDTILTFGPEGMTGHTDHATVSRWVSAAVEASDHKPAVYHAVELQEVYDKYLKKADEMFNIYFNIDKPPLKTEEECDICFYMDRDQQLIKRKALEVMPSQTEGLLKHFDEQLFCEVFRCECFVRA
jgi:LmbE family N-acetylglucosaminyl deacetylase